MKCHPGLTQGAAMGYPRTERQRGLMRLTATLADRFAERAAEHDRDNSFPFENVRDMHEAGYLALTVPEEYGGLGANVLEFVLCQQRLAQGDGATALAVGMHLANVGRLAETKEWPEDRFSRLCHE